MYKNPKVLQENGTLSTDKGHIYLDVQAEFYLFRPKINKECTGIVNKTGKDHIGCLVNQTFNVSIPKPANDKRWQGAYVRKGDEILLKITFTDLFYIIPYIRGEIIEILKQAKAEQTDDLNTSKTSPSKKKKSSHQETTGKRLKSDIVQENGVDSLIKTKKKRSKIIDGSGDIEEMQRSLLTSVLNESNSPVKHKKKKKDKSFKESEKYQSLQLQSPRYEKVVPSNTVTTYHESISPKKGRRLSEKVRHPTEVSLIGDIADLPDKSILDSPGFSSTLKSSSSPKTKKHKKKHEISDSWAGVQNDLLQKILNSN